MPQCPASVTVAVEGEDAKVAHASAADGAKLQEEPAAEQQQERTGQNSSCSGGEPAAAVQCAALVPFQKARGVKAKIIALKQKHFQGYEAMSPEECRANMEKKVAEADAKVQAALAFEKTKVEEVGKARRGYVEAKDGVEEAIKAELEAAHGYRLTMEQRKEAVAATEDRKTSLFEAQKRLAMLEVVRTNQVVMRQLQEERAAALEAAKEAKKSYVEFRQSEKKALAEAAMKALAPLSSKAGEEPAQKRAHVEEAITDPQQGAAASVEEAKAAEEAA